MTVLKSGKTQASVIILPEQQKLLAEYQARTGATLTGVVRLAINQFFESQRQKEAA